MNITGINSNSATDPYQVSTQNNFKKRAQDFKALQSALQSGDLTSAQQAFSSLLKDQQGSTQAATPASSTSGQTSPLQNDFQALQSALQSGDLSGAQSAFATLKQDIQSAGGAHRAHHHHHHQVQGAGNAVNGANQTGSSTDTASATDTASIISSLLDTQA
jgi:hypothetical protein